MKRAEIFACSVAPVSTVKKFVVIFTLRLQFNTDMVEDLSQNQSLVEEAIKQS